MPSEEWPSDPDAGMSAEEIRLPAEWEMSLDVLLDGQRVFTIAPLHHEVEADGTRAVAWPARLRNYLRGTAEVVIRDHVGGAVLLEGEVAFDDTPGRVRVVDSDGYPLALDKWGHLARVFGAEGSQVTGDLVRDVDRLLRTLSDDFGVPAYIAYGTLLGAVRTGHFIGHDTDADVAYLSAFEHPADIVRESFAMQRFLVERGWHVLRMRGAMMQVWAPDTRGRDRKIDIFASYFMDDLFSLDWFIRTELPRDALLPLSEVRLEGVTLPAPGRPDVVLAANYGPGWRVPDPAFTYQIPRSTTRRAKGWFGDYRRGQGPWRAHYAEVLRTDKKLPGPSAFARWVDRRRETSGTLVDLGCGLGGDTVWFARNGRPALGLEFVRTIRHRSETRVSDRGSAARFAHLSLHDFRATVVQAAELATAEEPPTLYARRLLDALTPPTRDNLWTMAKIVRGHLYLEFRTDRAADGSPQLPERPWRITLDPDEIATEVTSRGGFVEHRELTVDDGWQVCRMVTGWLPC